MWFANFFVSGSMTVVMPFLSLYIESFGNYSEKYVQHWAGLTFSITFVSAFVFSPIWGKIGDRYGMKRVLLISGTGMGLSVLFMGFIDSVWHLFLLRFFMGFFSGFISISQAFIAKQTDKKQAGRVLGTLQTGSVTGSLLGPIVGGMLADACGFSLTFKLISISIFVSAGLTLLTKEMQLNENNIKKKHYTTKEVFQHIMKNPILLTALLLSSLEQIAHFSVQPILALFVSDLHGKNDIALFSGIAFSMTGLGNLLMSKSWGKIGDTYGYVKLLVALLIGAGLAYLPGIFINQYWQLVVVRFVLGLLVGGVIPLRIAYIRQETPIAMQGEMYGYNTSLRFFGNMIGPILGGFISGYFGFPAVFATTGTLLILSGILLFIMSQIKSKKLT
jgi:MFS family permease